MPNPVVIYALSDPRQPALIRYIGKTAFKLYKRLYHHMHEGAKPRAHKRRQWISSLVGNNIQPRIWPLEICNENNWPEREKYWIWIFKPLGLLNSTDGGDKGCIGLKHSEATRALYRLQRKGRRPHPNNIQKTIARNKRGLSEQSRQKISKALSGRKLGIGVLEKIMRSPGYAIAQQKLRASNEARKKRIACVETGEVFESTRAAAAQIGCPVRRLMENLRKNWRTRGLYYQYA